ncbi:MAG TPA: hypothetical protein DCQ32_02545, partial [Cyanobacteria bacterium UBA8156]|nr:hypothetical protein [Cyanobacteria bacterium UBA8156]
MRVFVWVGAGDRAGFQNPGAIVEGTTAAAELVLLVERLAPALATEQVTLLMPPAALTVREGLQWIEDRTEPGDGAIELRLGAFARPEVRGASAFFIAINAERQLQADVLLQTLVQGVPGMVQRGARPDTESALGRLAFCRDLRAPSLSLELGYLTNPSDRELLQTRREDLAIALATGLRQWLQDLAPTAVPPRPSVPDWPPIGVMVNGQPWPEFGVLVNGNAYVPAAIADRLGLAAERLAGIPRWRVQSQVYLQAIGLRDCDVSVGWEKQSRTVSLDTVATTCLGELDRLLGPGLSTAAQLTAFAQTEQPNWSADLADRLILESTAVGVNHDVVFCQLAVDTGFLQHSFPPAEAPFLLRERAQALAAQATTIPFPTIAALTHPDPRSE